MNLPKRKKIHLKGLKKFELKKALFILPNAFTLSSIFCGIYAILNVIANSDADSLYRSCVAIFFAGFFDMFDGRIARLTKTQSDFGMEFDSLADVVSFGVAPCVIVYKWALYPIGPMGIAFATFFAACGAIRLARFNVLAKRPQTDPNFFVGLPIPIAAATLIAAIMAHFKLYDGSNVENPLLVVVLVGVLSWLMVSNVLFWTFKNAKFGRKTILSLFALFMFFFVMGKKYPVSFILVSILGCYIFAGLVRLIAMSFKKVEER